MITDIPLTRENVFDDLMWVRDYVGPVFVYLQREGNEWDLHWVRSSAGRPSEAWTEMPKNISDETLHAMSTSLVLRSYRKG